MGNIIYLTLLFAVLKVKDEDISAAEISLVIVTSEMKEMRQRHLTSRLKFEKIGGLIIYA